MYGGLRAFVLRIEAEATEPILLDEQPGSALRGALFHALLRRFCMEPTSPSCAACQLNATCPVAGLVAPLRDESPRGRDVPRPFVLQFAECASIAAHPARGRPIRRYEGGEHFTFDVSLIGRAITYFPYLAMSMPTLELLGIGRWVPEVSRRGRPQIERIEAIDPFGQQSETLHARGEKSVRTPTLAVTAEQIVEHATQMPEDRLTIQFLTPTRLIADGHIMHTPHFYVLATRMAERLEALMETYGTAIAADNQLDTTARRKRYEEVREAARAVRLIDDATRWVDIGSYSARQRRMTPIGGFVGTATYEGKISLALRELLAWGEVLHVGKNAVKGDGLFRVTT